MLEVNSAASRWYRSISRSAECRVILLDCRQWWQSGSTKLCDELQSWAQRPEKGGRPFVLQMESLQLSKTLCFHKPSHKCKWLTRTWIIPLYQQLCKESVPQYERSSKMRRMQSQHHLSDSNIFTYRHTKLPLREFLNAHYSSKLCRKCCDTKQLNPCMNVHELISYRTIWTTRGSLSALCTEMDHHHNRVAKKADEYNVSRKDVKRF